MTGRLAGSTVAGALLDTVLTAFGDGTGGFYDTADDGERLIFRPADPTDNATPSGAFAAADALLSYGALTGAARYRDAAVAALRVLPPIAARYPRAAATGLVGGRGAAVRAGRDRDRRPGRRPAHRRPAARRPARGAARRGLRARLGADGAAATRRPRPFRCSPAGLVSGGPAAYVCRDFTCQAPVTTPAALRETLCR